MALLIKNKRKTVAVVNISRLLLALVMMLSGFLKATDPIGAMYKLQEYAATLSLDSLTDGWLLALAVAQSAFEFLLGLYLLMGIYRRAVPWLLLLTMLVFTPLSLYLWVNGSMSDCGCFGEAVTISNRATFFKNVLLLVLAVVVFMGRAYFVRTLSRRSRWVLVLFSLIYIFWLQTVCIQHLPVIDSGSFVEGKNLRAMVQFVPDRYDYMQVYEKDGEELLLPAGSTPEDGWNFVEERPVLVEQGREPELKNFSIVDWEYDIEMSDELLADTGYVCLVAIERMANASVTHVDRINDLYDHCVSNGITFCAATSSGDDEVTLWRKRTGAEYPVYWADAMLLRSMIRSNPGLLLLKDGVVVGKWNVSDIPDVEQLGASPTLMPDGVWSSLEKMKGWPFWAVLLFGMLFVITLFDVVLMALASRKLEKAVANETATSAVADKNEPVENSDEPQLPADGQPDNDETDDTN